MSTAPSPKKRVEIMPPLLSQVTSKKRTTTARSAGGSGFKVRPPIWLCFLDPIATSLARSQLERPCAINENRDFHSAEHHAETGLQPRTYRRSAVAGRRRHHCRTPPAQAPRRRAS